MLIPIGREDARIRRHAWVSYAIIAINVIVFILLNGIAEHRTDYGPINDKAEEVGKYFVQHPWLEVPPSLRSTVSSAAIESLKAQAPKRSTPPALIVERQQKKFDELCDELHTMIRATPGFRYAFYPDDPSLWSAITALFIHGDLGHILGNMLIFFITAPFVEDVFGRPLFLALYLIGGLVSTWVHVMQTTDPVPLIGASGAIAAIMGAYLVRFHKSRIEFLFMPILFLPRLSKRFFLPAFVVLPIWFFKEFAFAVWGAESGIAVWAHVGGFVFGFCAALGIRALKLEEKWIEPAIEGQISWKVSEDYEAAAEAYRLGDLSTAKQHLAKLLEKNPEDVDARRLLCDVAAEGEAWPVLGPMADRLVDQYRKRGEAEMIRGFLFDMLPHGAHLSNSFCMKAGAEYDRMHDGDTAIAYYRHVVDRSANDLVGLKALLQILRIEITLGDLTAARRTAEAAAAHAECAGGFREALDMQLARLGESTLALS